MRVFSSLDTVALDRSQAVTIGSFDGVHRGHRYLLEQTAAQAKSMGAEVTVVTFWPPPITVLDPSKTVSCLMVNEEKLAALAATGLVDQVIVLPFTHTLAALNASDFITQLRAHMPLVALVEGDDFKLGHNREGTMDWLSAYGAPHGIVVRRIVRRVDGDRPISSTRIRGALEAGDVVTARELLGHPYAMAGEVIHGDARGRELGYPTANMRIDVNKLIPAHGIYAVWGWRASSPQTVWKGAASIGVRPVFNGVERRVEVFFLDMSEILYGETLCIEFVQQLREESNFPTVAALVTQMGHDVAQVRTILERQGNEG